ncbi:MAG: type II toxin-antitoxin system Phd/YefM family antitoxin [Phycisphaerae bacterium]
MPETLDISEARKKFNTFDQDLREQPVIYITRHNKQAFAIVNIEYLETMIETMEVLSDPDAMAMLNESLKAIQEGRLIDHEEVEKEFL